VALNFCRSLILRIANSLCFAGTNFCDRKRLVFLAYTTTPQFEAHALSSKHDCHIEHSVQGTCTWLYEFKRIHANRAAAPKRIINKEIDVPISSCLLFVHSSTISSGITPSTTLDLWVIMKRICCYSTVQRYISSPISFRATLLFYDNLYNV